MLEILKKHKYTTRFILIIIVLGAPYTLKLLSSKLEIYPSIILPAGAGKVSHTDGRFQFTATTLHCTDATTGKETTQQIGDFLYPIPRQYFKSILANDFGLNPGKEQTIRFRKKVLPLLTRKLPNLTYSHSAVLHPDNIEETKAWLRGRLRTVGCTPEGLLVRQSNVVLDIATRTVLRVEVEKEHKFDL